MLTQSPKFRGGQTKARARRVLAVIGIIIVFATIIILLITIMSFHHSKCSPLGGPVRTAAANFFQLEYSPRDGYPMPKLRSA